MEKDDLSALETEKKTIPQDVVVYSDDYKKLLDAKAYAGKYYEIDERVEEICKEAFKGCDKLEEIVMPKKLKKIDSEAFQGCSSLTKLTLPDSVMSIGDFAFRGCTGLVKITSLAKIPPVCDSEVFDGVNKTNCELIVPEGSVAAYTRAEDWNEFSNIRGFSE
jgi:hypothetical protein